VKEILDQEGISLTREQFLSSFGQRNDAILGAWLGQDVSVGKIGRIGDAKEARYRELVRKRVDPKSPLIWETDIELPNINCPKCTLQVVQFMADHGYNVPGGYSYHHCAALEITADPAKPIDSRWPVSK